MNKKFLLIGVGLILLLAGAGGGAYYFLFAADEEGGGELSAGAETAPAEDEESTPTMAEMAARPEWKRMPELVGPVHFQGLVHHYAHLSVVLLLSDSESPNEFEKEVPYVHDAFVREIHGAPITHSVDSMDIDVQRLAQRLRERANRTVGRDAVKKVEIRGIRHASPI